MILQQIKYLSPVCKQKTFYCRLRSCYCALTQGKLYTVGRNSGQGTSANNAGLAQCNKYGLSCWMEAGYVFTSSRDTSILLSALEKAPLRMSVDCGSPSVRSHFDTRRDLYHRDVQKRQPDLNAVFFTAMIICRVIEEA